MLLTEEQLREIAEIISRHHSAFVVNTVGPNAVSPQVLEELRQRGMVNVKVDGIKDAYLYGQALAASRDPKLASMSYEQFKAYLSRNPIPLSPIEDQAVKFAQQKAAQYVVGLGNRVVQQTGQILIEADAAQRQRMRDEIKDKTAENISKRQSVKKLKSDLGHSTKDWARDWDRIAVTEKHDAMQRGTADYYGKRYGGDVRVAKLLAPDACGHCKRLHLGPDGHPRIFKLSDLEANGTNVGRRAVDWLPTVGPVHPFCQCQLIRVPQGWGFDQDGSLVPGGAFGVEYDDEEDMHLALWEEDDLQKSIQVHRHAEFQGIPIAIENPVGSTRQWDDGEGGTGYTVMKYAYGYVEKTVGTDQDEIDVFLGPDPRAKIAYVMHQQNPKTGLYDEDKVMLGFSNQEMAEQAYRDSYDGSDLLLTCTPMEMEHFKRWVMATQPKQGEMFKAESEKFVIPLRKSGKLASEVGAATSQAGNRSPSPGTSPNLIFRAPSRPVPTSIATRADDEALQFNKKQAGRDPMNGSRLKPEDHEFRKPVRVPAKPVKENKLYTGDPLAPGETEERRKQLDKHLTGNRGVSKNTLDPKDSSVRPPVKREKVRLKTKTEGGETIH